MAVNVQVYDLIDYPDNNKTVTIDIKQVTPIGFEGDEQWVLSVTTTAYATDYESPYSDLRLSIQDVFIMDQTTGWAKSSGLLDTTKFTITGSNNVLSLKIDGDVSWRSVTVASGTYQADSLGDAIELGIRALAAPEAAAEGDLGYLNASVEYDNGRFKIVSGSMSETAAVVVDATSTLGIEVGFDKGITSLLLSTADYEPKESSVATGGYTTPEIYIDLASAVSWSTGDAFAITEGGNNPSYEYFIGVSGTSTRIYVQTLDNTYLDSNYSAGDKIQKLRYQDPEAIPTPWYQDVDAIVRWGIKTQANQIDFEQ